MADYTKAAELDPADPAPLVNRGLLHAERQEYAAAIDDYDKALKAAPISRSPTSTEDARWS